MGRGTIESQQGTSVKLKGISKQIGELSGVPAEHELDADAVVDLNLAESLDKLIVGWSEYNIKPGSRMEQDEVSQLMLDIERSMQMRKMLHEKLARRKTSIWFKSGTPSSSLTWRFPEKIRKHRLE